MADEEALNGLELIQAKASAQLRLVTEAERICGVILVRAREHHDGDLEAHEKLTEATIYMLKSLPEESKAAAEQAYSYFSRSGQLESEWSRY